MTMLLHEIEPGQVEKVANIPFVYPPETNRPVPVPEHLDIYEEKDGTKTLSGPLHVKTGDGLFAYYLIHGNWNRHKIGV